MVQTTLVHTLSKVAKILLVKHENKCFINITMKMHRKKCTRV
jgi:hypothetical protein